MNENTIKYFQQIRLWKECIITYSKVSSQNYTADLAKSIRYSRIGRVMAQAVSRRPVTAEVRVRSWNSPCDICSGHSGTGAGLSPSSSLPPDQYHSTVALHTRMSLAG
jgi:hypothetical protein